MPSASINGTTLGYMDRGTGPAVMLVHGFPLDRRMWDAQVEALSTHYRVIAPDLRGFGRNDPGDVFSIESLADDLDALARHLGVRPFVLCGLSMGGYVSLAYATRHLDGLRGLVLIDTRAEADTPEGREGRRKMIDLVRTSGSSAVADAMFPKLVAPELPRNNPEVAARLRAILNDCPPGTIEAALMAMRDRRDYTEELKSIAIPALVIVGEADAITRPASARAMVSRLPNATLEIIPGAGHMSPMERPMEVNAAMRRFLLSIP